MPKEIIIDVNATGAAESLHFDDFALMNILEGKAKVTRASSIVFDEETKRWNVVLPNQEKPYEICCGFDGYNVAIAFEVEWLQSCRKANIDPAVNTITAITLASYARRKVLELGLKIDR
jgi:hypothetical protein